MEEGAAGIVVDTKGTEGPLFGSPRTGKQFKNDLEAVRASGDEGWHFRVLNSKLPDDGPRLIGGDIKAWARQPAVEPRFIQHGKTNQNTYIDRFNRTCRYEVLDCCVFKNLDEVDRMTA